MMAECKLPHCIRGSEYGDAIDRILGGGYQYHKPTMAGGLGT
jgi:hypothetical protein